MNKTDLCTFARQALKCGVALPALLIAGTAFAQDAIPGGASSEDAAGQADIVVTGTLIRGQAPTGSDRLRP